MSNHSIQAVSREQAREDKQLRIALVDSVTHELRTLLSSIKASVTAQLTNSQLRPWQPNELLIVINESVTSQRGHGCIFSFTLRVS